MIALLPAVLERASQLPFVVLVGWLERLLPRTARVGGAGPYREEPVHFVHDPALSFHAQDVNRASQVEIEPGIADVEVETTFLGLTGSSSPLPPLLVEGMAKADDDEQLQREFFDIFHHRLLGLTYRGMLKFDLPRTARHGTSARALDWVLLFAGFQPADAERITGLNNDVLLRLAPLLVSYSPNAERLALAIRTTFADLLGDARVHVSQMRGGHLEIDPASRARLGVDLRLGLNGTLGRRAPAPASAVVLQIAPLTPESCARLSPRGDRHRELTAVALLFCPETIEIGVELTPSFTPPSRLRSASAVLGRNAWLGGRGRPVPVRFAVPSWLPTIGKDHHAS